MRSTAVLLAAAILLAPAALSGAGNPIVGKWACVSKSDSGPELQWTMVVAEDGGKLSGRFVGETGDEVPLVEPKFEGDTFSFKIDVNPSCIVDAKLKVTGDKFEGTFGCAEAAGTLKGTKQP